LFGAPDICGETGNVDPGLAGPAGGVGQTDGQVYSDVGQGGTPLWKGNLGIILPSRSEVPDQVDETGTQGSTEIREYGRQHGHFGFQCDIAARDSGGLPEPQDHQRQAGFTESAGSNGMKCVCIALFLFDDFLLILLLQVITTLVITTMYS